MGYTTDFEGSLRLSKQATPEQIKYLNTFAGTRRMKRDVEKLQEMFKGDYGFNGSYGHEGEYFAKDDGNSGQNIDESIKEYNHPATGTPSLWCQWVLNDGGTELEWDGEEKFYDYIGWLEYLIKNFFSVWGIELSGIIKWRGEDFDDIGRIGVLKNDVITNVGWA